MVEDGRVQAFVSPEVLQEIHRVLEYERILRILKRSGKQPSSLMATIMSLCSLIDQRSMVDVIQDDPADNHVLACAKDARADFVISGDRHLLKLGEYEKIKVLTATNFLKIQELTNAD